MSFLLFMCVPLLYDKLSRWICTAYQIMTGSQVKTFNETSQNIDPEACCIHIDSEKTSEPQATPDGSESSPSASTDRRQDDVDQDARMTRKLQ